MSEHKLIDFIFGFIIVYLILYLYSRATLSQFFGLIYNVETALMVSLVLSVILFIVFIAVVILSFVMEYPLLGIGGVVGFITAYLLSESVRLGFGILFEFI